MPASALEQYLVRNMIRFMRWILMGCPTASWPTLEKTPQPSASTTEW